MNRNDNETYRAIAVQRYGEDIINESGHSYSDDYKKYHMVEDDK
jgi:hypothetical protein